MITRLIWTIWTPMSSAPQKADKLNPLLSLSVKLTSNIRTFIYIYDMYLGLMHEYIGDWAKWCHFTDNNFKCFTLKEEFGILNKISMKCVCKGDNYHPYKCISLKFYSKFSWYNNWNWLRLYQDPWFMIYIYIIYIYIFIYIYIYIYISVLPNHPSTRPRQVKSCFGRVKISVII